MQFQRSLTIVSVAFVMAACGGGGGGSVPDPVLRVEKWTPSGDNQTDTVAQTLPNVIRVKVTLDGAVTAGVTVNFSGGNLGTTSMVTGDNGIATSTWTLAPEAGVQEVTVTVDSAVGSPLTFHATAVPGPATQLLLVSGDGQASETNLIFGSAFSVRVADALSNGIPGRWVFWSKTGPVVLSTDSMITNVNGSANMFATAGGTEGGITVTATVDGLAGSPVTFNGVVTASPLVIHVGSNFFNPQNPSISAGSAVKWTWDASNHSVASYGADLFQGSDVQLAGDTWGPILFSTPGVYTYECAVHTSNMRGTITVN